MSGWKIPGASRLFLPTYRGRMRTTITNHNLGQDNAHISFPHLGAGGVTLDDLFIMFLCWGESDLSIAFSTHPESQASSRGEAKDTALLSSRDGYILELTVWPKMSQASCGVWREDSGLLSRPYSKRRPSSREDWGVSWVFSSCGSSVVLLTRYNGELREPLLWRQGSQVSMRVARGSASLLSSHGRGIAPQDALKKDSRGLLRVGPLILSSIFPSVSIFSN